MDNHRRGCLALAALVWLSLPAHTDEKLTNLCLPTSGGMPTALASAPDFRLSAAKACDGKLNTGWVSAAAPNWLRVEWRVPVEVQQIVIRPLHDPRIPAHGVGRCQVQVRTGGTWKTVAQCAGGKEVWTHSLAESASTTAVRLRFDSAAAMGVAEFEVLGPPLVLPQEWLPRWQGRWIWCEPSLLVPRRQPVRRYFRRTFQVADPKNIAAAWLSACAFDRLDRFWVNNHPALQDISYYGGSLRRAKRVRVPAAWLLPGENVLAAAVDDLYEAGSHGLLAELELVDAAGQRTLIATDDQWLGQADQGVVPDWRLPGLKDNRWRPCSVRTWPNTRWHWLWNVPRPLTTSPDALTLRSLSFDPQPVAPGDKVRLHAVFETRGPLSRDYALVVRLGQPSLWRNHDYELWGAYQKPEQLATRKWSPGAHQVTLDVPVPDYAPAKTPVTLTLSTPDGAVRLQSRLPDVIIDEYGAHFDIRVDRGWKPRPPADDFPHCRVRTIAGNPTLFIDDQPTAPILWSSSYGNYQRYRAYSKSGVKLFRMHLEGSPICAPGEEGEYYPRWFAEVDRMIAAAVGVDPDIRLLLGVWMDPHPEWLFAEPSEQTLGGGGQLVIPLSHQVPDRGQVRPTFLSQAWRRAGAEGLTRLVKHLRQQPFAGNIIGCCFMAGRAGENYWGGNEFNIFINEQGEYDCKPRDQWQVGDFSMAARLTFRDFAQRKYGSVEKLRRAWQRDDITFDDILNPARFRREEVSNQLTWAGKPSTAGSMRDPLQPGVGVLPMDYFQCMAQAMIDTFAAWGHAVKEASAGRLLTGCYYGYAISQLYTSIPGFHAHTAVARASRSPDLDFFVSPSEYNAARRAGGPYWGLNIIDSLRLHNKLWIYEQDTRTFLAEHMPKTFSRAETLAVMKRDAAAALTRGVGWWWYEFASGQQGAGAREWFLDPEILGFATEMKRLYDSALQLPDRGPSAQIAVFYHGESLTAQDLFPPTGALNITIGRLTLVDGMQRIGAPFDLYNLADIPLLAERRLLEQYRLLVFLNPFYLGETERGWLDLCKRAGKTLVWLWAPGIAGPGRPPSPENVSALTAIPGIRWAQRKAVQTCRPRSGLLLTTGLPDTLTALPYPPGATWERFGNQVWPVLFVAPRASGNATTVLAHWVLDDKRREDRAALVLRPVPCKGGAWNSVYAAIPYLPPRLLRNLARFAGVHEYWAGNDILFASPHFIALHTGAQPADGVLHLPAATAVVDVFDHRLLAKDADRLTIHLPPFSTALYALGPAAERITAAKRP